MTTNKNLTNACSVSPYLIVENVARCIKFLEQTFDASLQGKLERPNGTLMHAEVVVGDSVIMMGEPMGEFGPMPASIFVYVPEPEKIFGLAKDNGGEVIMEFTEQASAGVKYGGVKDPGGNVWFIAAKTEDVPWQEQQARINATAQLWSKEEL